MRPSDLSTRKVQALNDRRAQVIGGLLGVVALGGLVAFGVGLPQAVGDSKESDDTPSAITLPDGIDAGGFVADSIPDTTRTDGQDPVALAKQVSDIEASASEGLTELYGVPAAARGYHTIGAQKQISITAVALKPGLFAPNGLPIDGSLFGLTRLQYELSRVDGAVCEVDWETPVKAGQPIDPNVLPQSVRCQLGVGERTYEGFAIGMTADEVVTTLKAVSEA